MHYDVIHMLAAGIKQLPSGRWVSTDLSEDDDALGSPGGKLHILAVAELLKDNPGAIVKTGGGKGYGVLPGTPEDRPILARILSDELSESGVPMQRMRLEPHSNNTIQELELLVSFMKGHRGKRVAIVTGEWHIARVRAMLEAKFPDLLADSPVELVAAERVLVAKDPSRWQELIDAAYRSEWMAKRKEMEGNGERQIRDGTYKLRMLEDEVRIVMRLADESDRDTLLLWRNDPKVHRFYLTPKPETPENHERWFAASLKDPDRRIWIAERDGQRVGMMRFDHKGDRVADLSWAVDPINHGKGIGTAMLRFAREMHDGTLVAEIHRDNRSSITMVEKAGFDPTDPDPAHPDFLRYRSR